MINITLRVIVPPLVTLTDVNEAPTSMVYEGLEVVPQSAASDFALGKFTVLDEDAADYNNHEISILWNQGDAYPFFEINADDSVEVRSTLTKAGTFVGVFKATDKGGLFITDTVILTVTDTSAGEDSACGIYHEYLLGYNYVGGDYVYNNNYIYRAKWGTAVEPTPLGSDWLFIEACQGVATCSDFGVFAGSNKEFNSGGIVSYNGKVYRATTYSKNKTPSNYPAYWDEVCECL